jgi:hypothetical protein
VTWQVALVRGVSVVPDSCYCTTGGSQESDPQYRPARPVWISARPRGQFDQPVDAGVFRPEGHCCVQQALQLCSDLCVQPLC